MRRNRTFASDYTKTEMANMVADAQDERDALQRKVSALEDTLAGYRQTRVELEAELAQVKDELRRTKQAWLDAMDRYKSDLSTAEGTIAALRAQLAQTWQPVKPGTVASSPPLHVSAAGELLIDEAEMCYILPDNTRLCECRAPAQE